MFARGGARVFAFALLALSITHIDYAAAFSSGGIKLGIGFYSQNSGGEITKQADGAPSSLGSSSLPLFLKYDWNFMGGWFFAPQLSYTPIGRTSAGDSTTTTMTQLLLPVGTEITRSGEMIVDWEAGLAVSQYTMTGAGGTEQLSNGTGTSTFARPGRTVTTKTVALMGGISASQARLRFAFDLFIEGIATEKRTPSLMLSFAYMLNQDH